MIGTGLHKIRWAAALLALVAGCDGGGAAGPGQSQSASTTELVKFVGFDGSQPLVEALKSGELQGLVLQNPLRMGSTAVKTLVAHLEGSKVEAKIPTGETMVTRENMDRPDVVALLNPPKVGHSADASLTGAKTKKWRVMVIPKGTTHEFWKTIHAGAAQAAEELGNVEIVWQGPQKEDDRLEQIKLVQTAMSAKVDGIVLAPLDFKALAEPVEEAMDSGIPVVIIDSAIDTNKIVSYVATDNYNGGVLAAKRLIEILGGKGKIILMRYAVGSAATDERERGFTDTIAKMPGISYLSQDQFAGATSDTAQRTAQSLVTRFRGQVEGIFCPNESSAAGMLRALRDAGLVTPTP